TKGAKPKISSAQGMATNSTAGWKTWFGDQGLWPAASAKPAAKLVTPECTKKTTVTEQLSPLTGNRFTSVCLPPRKKLQWLTIKSQKSCTAKTAKSMSLKNALTAKVNFQKNSQESHFVKMNEMAFLLIEN